MTDIQHIQDFLPCATPDKWLENALDNQTLMLVDHANCEKKAASTALNLIYRYTDNFELLTKMSRLAREEMRHFEQVISIMKRRNIPYLNITASRYAGGLREQARANDPGKLVDVLVIGALIEARSFAGDDNVDERIALFSAREKQLIEEPDTEFRFHSGPVL